MEVISDRKIAHNNSGTIDYFEADVISYSDYYPFGMEMPGRCGSIADYRYAYNGMEVDHEVSGHGNSYTTQFRQYDPRLGRWKSLDPMAYRYPDQSPFTAFNNNPIYFVDLDGQSGEPANKPPHPRVFIWKPKDYNPLDVVAKYAEGLKVPEDGNIYHIFAHGSSNRIVAETSKGTGKSLRTPEQFVEFMSSVSEDFRDQMENNETIIIYLHSCNTGADTDKDGNPIDSPIAAQITEQYPNIIVVAPDGKCVTSSGSDPWGRSTGDAYEKGYFDRYDLEDSEGRKGALRVFEKGKAIAKNKSVGLPDPNKPRDRKALRQVNKSLTRSQRSSKKNGSWLRKISTRLRGKNGEVAKF